MSREFSAFHALVGMFVTLLAIVAHVSPVGCAAAVVALGWVHETVDGDLYEGGLPWYLPLGYEGWKDLLSFLPGPFVYALWGGR